MAHEPELEKPSEKRKKEVPVIMAVAGDIQPTTHLGIYELNARLHLHSLHVVHLRFLYEKLKPYQPVPQHATFPVRSRHYQAHLNTRLHATCPPFPTSAVRIRSLTPYHACNHFRSAEIPFDGNPRQAN